MTEKQEADRDVILLSAMLVQVAFVVLKFAGIIDWSWAWVLAPLWVPLAAVSTLIITTALLRTVVVRYQAGAPDRAARSNERKLARHEADLRR